MTVHCDLCGRADPTGGYVCPTCANRARRDLRAIAELTPAVRAIAYGLARHGSTIASRTTEIRLPLDLAAVERLDRAQSEITTIARHVAGERGEHIPAVADPLIGAALWLTQHVEWLRHRREAAEMVQTIADCRRALAAVAYRPTERRWLGQCGADTDSGPCQVDLVARIDAKQVTCRGCGATHDVAARRQWLAEVVRGYAYAAAEIADAYGIPAATIRSWAHRGRIVAVGEVDGRPVYPLGDVLRVASEARWRSRLDSRREVCNA